MTIAKEYASKLAVASVAIAMIFMAVAPAKAQTSEDLQKMINDLLAQVAALQSSTGQASTVSSDVCPYTWTRDLTSGAKGADVMKLQKFLNSDADTRVAATGAGSLGAETEFYGPATAAAVSKFQVKYRSETLSPANLVNPTGYFGPASRGKANGLCTTAAPVDDEDTSTSTDEDADDEDVALGGEADLDKYEADDAQDDSIEEGATDAEVAVFTAEFADGDASISRLDVAFTNATVGAHAWDAFETISLWVDGDKVAEADASSKDDYLGDEDNGIIRFSGLDLVAMDGEPLEITVAATIQGNLDAEELATAWTVKTESLRFFDADGVATTDTTLVDIESAAFDLDVAGSDDEALVKTSSNNPAATTLKLNNDKKSDNYPVFAFDIDTDDSTNDLDVNEVVLTVTVSSSTYNNIVDDAELTIDGTKITDVSVMNGTTSTAILTFNVDGDVTIEAGDRVEAELGLVFKSLALGNEGITVTSAVAAGAIEVEGADTFTSDNTANGKVHTLRTSGAVLEAGAAVAPVGKPNTDAVTTDDAGTFVLKFDVTAFDQDLYINKTTVEGVTPGTEGVNYVVTNGSGVTSATEGTPTASLSATAPTEGTQYKVAEGETETFTLTVDIDPTTTDYYGVKLYSLNFKDVGGNPTAFQTALPAEDFETTPALNIKN
jgi:hypothetical protein